MKKGLVAAEEIANRDKKKIFLLSKEKKKWFERGKNQFHFFFLSQVLSRQHFVFEKFLEDFEIVA